MRPELGCRAVYFNRLAACSETLFFSCTAPDSICHLHHLQEQKQQQRHTSSISTTCFSLVITPQRLLCSTLLAYSSIAFVNSLLCSPHFLTVFHSYLRGVTYLQSQPPWASLCSKSSSSPSFSSHITYAHHTRWLFPLLLSSRTIKPTADSSNL